MAKWVPYAQYIRRKRSRATRRWSRAPTRWRYTRPYKSRSGYNRRPSSRPKTFRAAQSSMLRALRLGYLHNIKVQQEADMLASLVPTRPQRGKK